MLRAKPFDVDNWTRTAAFAAHLEEVLTLAHDSFVEDIGEEPYDSAKLARAAYEAAIALYQASQQLGGFESITRTLQTALAYDEQMGDALVTVSDNALKRFDGVTGAFEAIAEDPETYGPDLARTLERDYNIASTALKAMNHMVDNAAQDRNDKAVRSEFKLVMQELAKAQAQLQGASDGLSVYTLSQLLVAPTSEAARRDLETMVAEGIKSCQQTLEEVLTDEVLWVNLLDRVQSFGESLASKEQTRIADAVVQVRDAYDIARQDVDENGHIEAVVTISLALPNLLGGLEDLSNALLYSVRIGEPLYGLDQSLPTDNDTPNI